MAGKYDLRRSGAQYFWNLKAANGETILTQARPMSPRLER